MAGGKAKAIRAGRCAVARGARPRYQLDIRAREVKELPWLEFDGSAPAAIAEAARRCIAAELGVRADQVEVETSEPMAQTGFP